MAKILVIEDDNSIAKIIGELFRDAGHEVGVAADGLRGIQMFRNDSWDIVLLDIMMPKLNGYSVCRMIREESNIPIIMLTALGRVDANSAK